MNAVVLAYGHAVGGPAGASTRWKDSGAASATRRRFSPIQRTPFDVHARATGRSTDRRLYLFYDIFMPAVLALRPSIRATSTRCATSSKRRSISSGCERLPDQALHQRHQRAHRRGARLPQRRAHADVVLASACLPLMYQAIEIDGEPYWDGGFSGNPPATPLIHECDAQRHRARADQPDRASRHATDRARDPQPHERDLFQLRLKKELR